MKDGRSASSERLAFTLRETEGKLAELSLRGAVDSSGFSEADVFV